MQTDIRIVNASETWAEGAQALEEREVVVAAFEDGYDHHTILQRRGEHLVHPRIPGRDRPVILWRSRESALEDARKVVRVEEV